MAKRSPLITLVDRLHRKLGDPFLPPTADAFGLILWEQVAYLADDARRMEAFHLLRDRVGLTPAAVASAPLQLLNSVAATGGSIAVATRANRMRESARMTIEEWDGELDRALSYPDGARRALKRFPMIGLPGADKILLLTRTHPVLALDSNGLRVLLRVGYGTEGRSYATTYRSVQEAIASEVTNDYAWLTRAHGILRQHGQGDCKRNWPACPECPIRDRCSFVSAPGR